MEKLRMKVDRVGKGCRLLIVTLLMAASNSTARGDTGFHAQAAALPAFVTGHFLG
jgi:hypothetical protein